MRVALFFQPLYHCCPGTWDVHSSIPFEAILYWCHQDLQSLLPPAMIHAVQRTYPSAWSGDAFLPWPTSLPFPAHRCPGVPSVLSQCTPGHSCTDTTLDCCKSSGSGKWCSYFWSLGLIIIAEFAVVPGIQVYSTLHQRISILTNWWGYYMLCILLTVSCSANEWAVILLHYCSANLSTSYYNFCTV